MKKIFIGGLVCSILLVSGCESEKKDISSLFGEVKAEPKVNLYDVTYDLKAVPDTNKVKVHISMENAEKSPIPLLTKDGNLFSVKLKQKDGKLIKEEIIQLEDRKQLLKNEMIYWDVEFEANIDEEVLVETDLLLKSEDYQKYDVEQKVKNVPVVLSTNKLDTYNVSFAPVENAIYTYKLNKKKKIREEFKFFNENKVQSFSEKDGVKIMSQESDGIYLLSIQDPVGDIDGTEFINKEDMQLMIPFPIEEGITWKNGDKKYTLSDTNVPIKTRLGIFENCIEIIELNKKEKRFYYYHKDIGLIQVKLARKGLPSKIEMELIKIKQTQEKLKEKKKKND